MGNATLTGLAYFLAITSPLVLVHELGHYWAARANGVRIEAFSIGFGPELFGRTDRRGTRWKLSAIPLGGYIKMFGEDGTARQPLPPTERAACFRHKRLAQRAAIAAAGPLANFVFAVLLLAGLMAVLDPAAAPATAHSVFDQAFNLLWGAVETTWRLTFEVVQAIWQFAIGTRAPQELMGPMRLVQASDTVAHQGILPMLLVMAVFSVNLGVTNLLPIPTLDGGHLLFCLVEAIRGRPLGRQAETFAMRLGLAFVTGLMLFAIWNDMVHIPGR